MTFPRFRPGPQPPVPAKDMNRMSSAAERAVGATAEAGGMAQIDLPGGRINYPGPEREIWIRILSTPGVTVDAVAAYDWEMVLRQGDDISAFPSQRGGTIASFPAYELMGATDVPEGTIVRARVGESATLPGMEFVWQGDGLESCTEFAVRCADGVLITKFLRGRFTVSDTPCGGLGGRALGGPPLGEGMGRAAIPSGTGSVAGTSDGTDHCLDRCTRICIDAFGWPEPHCIANCCDGRPPAGGDRSMGVGWDRGLGGPPLGRGIALGGSTALDPFPRGTSPQVLGFDSSGNLIATTLSSSLGTISPAALSADQNDYNPGAAGIMRLTTNDAGVRTLTGIGISQTDGQRLVIYNIGTVDSILLAIASGSSSAANRFANGTAVGNITVAVGTKREFVYSNSLWELLY